MPITDKDRLDFLEKNNLDIITEVDKVIVGYVYIQSSIPNSHIGKTHREAIDRAIVAMKEKTNDKT